MASLSERVIHFIMAEPNNYRCGYCYLIWEHNDPQAELHHSSRDLQFLLLILSDYFLLQISCVKYWVPRRSRTFRAENLRCLAGAQ